MAMLLWHEWYATNKQWSDVSGDGDGEDLFFSLTESDEEFWFSDWDSEFELPDDDNGEVDVHDDF